ncbi:MAG: hypothetical protein QOG91_187 [Candidatus Parcubacteria bacterium]|nr:hypothetical protein [Candidatus Parcubacteria bacterium]
MANDNGSYWKGYLGYPSIAFLMKEGIISYDKTLADLLKGMAWKDINQKFADDFEKTLNYILSSKSDDERTSLIAFAHNAEKEIAELNLKHYGKRIMPPKGY